ncbi:hypothetical protein EPJ64_10545 [Brachyspira aalborgi]|nr:hypothetical protein EPJ77_07675 [Brachyspira aalborgi]TXJ18336.1 hypothetical protein EPJ64_10545 [Brachyspira aalborgi]
MDNFKNSLKNIITILKYVIFIVLLVFVILVILYGIYRLYNSFNFIHEKDTANIIGVLSLNVAILQSIIGLGAIFIALFAFINFKSTHNKIKKLNRRVKYIEDYKSNNNTEPENLN